MCGRYNISDDPFVRALMNSLGLNLMPDARRNIAPGAFGQFVIERDRERLLLDGIWSLLIEQKANGAGFRPNPKWKSFNAKSTRLNQSPLWKKRFAQQRAIVPMTGFHEWQGKQCFQITANDQALAIAGLYELWTFEQQIVPSFSVITLEPHSRFAAIHDKSVPLILRANDFDAWLDPANTHNDMFTSLLHSHLPVALCATPIDNPMSLNPVDAPLHFEADTDEN